MLQVAQKLLAGYFNSELWRKPNSIQDCLVDSRNQWYIKHLRVFQNMKKIKIEKKVIYSTMLSSVVIFLGGREFEFSYRSGKNTQAL